jgi:hypothetical protein
VEASFQGLIHFPHLFVQPVIYISMTCTCLHYTLYLILLLIFFFQFCHWKMFQLVSTSLWYAQNYHYFLRIFLLSGTIGHSTFILYIFCHPSKISHFSKELWFLLLKAGIRKKDLSISCAPCCWGLYTSRPSKQRVRKYLYAYESGCFHVPSVYLSTHTHTHNTETSISFYTLCNLYYKAKHKFTLTSLILIH